MSNRTTPLPVTPHSKAKNRVAGLRDYSSPPLTYMKYQQMPDGTVVFVGEFPTPEIEYDFRNNGGSKQ